MRFGRRDRGRIWSSCMARGGLQFWSPDLELLSKSYRVTAPIHPGFGRSTGIDDIDSVLDAVLHTFDVLEQLDIRRPHVMGHSMGGMLAAEMAATCPNDLASITLVCPVGLWDDAHPVLDFFTLMPIEIVPHIFHDVNHPVAKAMGVTPTNDEQIVDMYVTYLKGLSAAGRLLWPIPDRGLNKRIDRIKCPTLILWGESDGLVPVHYAHEFGRRINGAHVNILKKASHMVLLEKPAESASAISEFISQAIEEESARSNGHAVKPLRSQGNGARTGRAAAPKKTQVQKGAGPKRAAPQAVKKAVKAKLRTKGAPARKSTLGVKSRTVEAKKPKSNPRKRSRR